MTRETKIGLLVGLAFIIVIGILLSDHFRATMDTPQAPIAGIATNVRETVNSPGTAHPPITVVTPQDAPPRQPVPTTNDLTPPVRVVVPSPANTGANGNTTAINNTAVANTPATVDGPPVDAPANGAPVAINPPTKPQPRNPTNTGNSLAEIAARNGEPIAPLNPDGTRSGDGEMPHTQLAATTKTYKVQPGDTVSKLAGRFLGSNTKSNRQAIIDANPSLKADPDKVIVGQIYIIPGAPHTDVPLVSAPGAPAAPASPAPAPKSAVNPAAQYTYTAAEGDSLWRIANDELGDPSAVDAIKELNLDVLKGKNHDVVITGSKLRLPAKPLASAN